MSLVLLITQIGIADKDLSTSDMDLISKILLQCAISGLYQSLIQKLTCFIIVGN